MKNDYQELQQLMRIATRKGFVAEFWRLLAASRKADPNTSRRKVFERLNDLYFDTFGVYLYPSYNAFRHSKEFLGKD
ncbi:MAG: hypothetical protein IIZ24_01750 [Candidatus Methanomethylophilus sp.]|nr:hypothetical protein [Methanomethylophilus sp.]